MGEFWKVAVGIAGIGAVGAFVLWSLYKNWLKLPALENRLTKHQIFILFLVFLVLTFLFGIASLVAFVIAQRPPADGPIVVIGPVTYQGGIDNETLKKILDASTGLAKESLRAKDQQLEQLKDAWRRVSAQAEKGDAQAKAALEEARRSGDTAKLEAVLIHEADRMHAIHGVTAKFLELCREIAAVAYLRGDIDEAYVRVQTILHSQPTDLTAINMRARIHMLRGELDAALSLCHQVLKLSSDESTQSVAYGNIGVISATRGELDRAEEMFRKALVIDERLGYQQGMANQCGNLGAIYRRRGDLGQAEEMHLKAMEIDKKLGRQETLAIHYGNLGIIYRMRDELDRAEEMHLKALAINEKLGRKEGLADQYGSLAAIYRERGELDRAEEMLKKSLAIEKLLGHQAGMAIAYGNLGLIYRARGELDRAEAMHQKALEIDEKLRDFDGMAGDFGNIAVILQTQGEFNRADQMYQKVLEIYEKHGNQEGMARSYSNLGSVAKARGDLDRARELWTKARDLFAKIGMPHMVKGVQGWLDGLPPGDAGE